MRAMARGSASGKERQRSVYYAATYLTLSAKSLRNFFSLGSIITKQYG